MRCTNRDQSNTLRRVNVRVQKTSKTDGDEPLKGARYGLWLYKPNGNDVYLGNKTSGEDGWMTFEDVPTPALAEDAANPKNVTLTYSDNNGVSDFAIDIQISKADFIWAFVARTPVSLVAVELIYTKSRKN